MTMPRVVARETLDHLPATAPEAMRSRRDLIRVHRAMGTRGLVLRGWQALWPSGAGRVPLKVLELGAGDGTLVLGVAQSLPPIWPRVHLTLLDRQQLVSAATLSAYDALGWKVEVEQSDVLDWAAAYAPGTPRTLLPSWDLISTTLFLHHFEGAALKALLAAVAVSGDRFCASEPRRAALALVGSHLVGALGANAVTREDAVLSVHAGFRDDELTALWPGAAGAWQLHEGPAGLFSHGFSARRKGVVDADELTHDL